MKYTVLSAGYYEPDSAGSWPVIHGVLAGGIFPAIPLTPCPEAASRHGDELDTVADLSREGPFDIHQDHPRSVASVNARHPGMSISDGVLRCRGRWTKLLTSIWGPAP